MMRVEIAYSLEYDKLVIRWSNIIGNKEYVIQKFFHEKITKEEFISESKMIENEFKNLTVSN